jgi:hypothetical protein
MTTWILLVYLWTDPPPKILIVYKKEFDSYEQCWNEQEKWIDKFSMTTCELKPLSKEQK